MRRRRPPAEVERHERAVDALDRIDDLMRQIAEATDTIDPTHLNGKDPRK
jgi:hypothetical protein